MHCMYVFYTCMHARMYACTFARVYVVGKPLLSPKYVWCMSVSMYVTYVSMHACIYLCVSSTWLALLERNVRWKRLFFVGLLLTLKHRWSQTSAPSIEACKGVYVCVKISWWNVFGSKWFCVWCKCVGVDIYTCLHTDIYVFLCKQAVCMYACVYVCMCMYVHVYMYMCQHELIWT